MLATLLPHEVRPTAHRNSDEKIYEKIHNILYDFGIWKKDCSAVMFWDKDLPVTSSEKDLLVTSYVRGKRILLVCGNYGEDSKALLTARRNVIRAVNMETEHTLPVNGKEVVLDIKKHDIAILMLELE